eukprot:GHVS01025944.1.p1 GENE.GHVS01025944.1~~GHVS01025944.1.p1  ORF type:complete len:370 (+),score=90.84 GHVS01025944.1:466-1575(+)
MRSLLRYSKSESMLSCVNNTYLTQQRTNCLYYGSLRYGNITNKQQQPNTNLKKQQDDMSNIHRTYGTYTGTATSETTTTTLTNKQAFTTTSSLVRPLTTTTTTAVVGEADRTTTTTILPDEVGIEQRRQFAINIRRYLLAGLNDNNYDNSNNYDNNNNGDNNNGDNNKYDNNNDKNNNNYDKKSGGGKTRFVGCRNDNNLIDIFDKQKYFLRTDNLMSALTFAISQREKNVQINTTEMKTRLEQLYKTAKPLEESKALLDRRVQRYGQLCVWSCVFAFSLQWTMLFYGTYYLFSWDIVEPLTYFLGSIDAVVGYIFAATMKRNYSASSLRLATEERRRRQLQRRIGFDPQELESVREEIAKIQKHLQSL